MSKCIPGEQTSEHDSAASDMLLSLAANEGTWWCGGSDYHGPTKPHVELGCVRVPSEVLTQGPFARLV